MASHRKLHPPVPHATAPSIPAPAPVVPVTASVALLPHGAEPCDAAGGPAPEEIERKIDELYRRADTATDGQEGAGDRNGGAAGVALPRATRDQSGAGTAVPLSEALPGDLVFFHDSPGSPGEVGHVGVYTGHGMMIHVPQPGAYVREDPVSDHGARVVHHVVRPA